MKLKDGGCREGDDDEGDEGDDGGDEGCFEDGE